MAKVLIELKEYLDKNNDSVLMRKNGEWVLVKFDELNKDNLKKFEKLDSLEVDFKALARNTKHFVKYAKSHFLVVFNYFKVKILSGEIDVIDEEILKLDEKVLNDEISVQDALAKHEFLQTTFDKVFSNEKEMLTFPEV